MDTQLLDCLFGNWGEEGYEENGEETCQGLTIATTETHAAGETSYDQFSSIHFLSLFFVMQIILFHVCIVTIVIILITVSAH